MSDRLGTAQWEEQPLVSRKYPFDQGKFWLGRAEDATAIGYRDDRHICLVSGTRGGKGTSVIVNNLCFWPGSAVVVDPKGENATVTAARRGQGAAEHCAGMRQAVHVLDPFNTAHVDDCYRSCFNPLADLDPQRDETIDEASRIANAIVVVKDDSHDPFWDESARLMLRDLILHVLTAKAFNDDERNLITVRKLISRGEWRLAEAIRELGHAEDKIDPPHLLLWRAMEKNRAFDGIVAGTGTRFRNLMVSSPKTFEGVLQALVLNTQFLDSPGMVRVLSKSDFKLSELKTRPEGMTLYLSLPQRFIRDTHFRWLRMMVALTTTEMEITRGQPASGHPVLMVLDEFAGLKRMREIEDGVAQLAGFGVKLFFVVQSLEQLKATYKDGWETFLSNAGLKIFFSIEDHFTREYISKLAGEKEIIRDLRSSNKSRSDNESYAEGTSQSRTLSQSTTRGTSTSRTRGTSQSETRGTSQSVNQSQTHSENKSLNIGESFGTNESFGWSEGTSSGYSATKRSVASSSIFEGPVNYTDSENFSQGQNSSVSGSRGINNGMSRGTSHGTSDGTSRGASSGTSRGSTFGSSESETHGESYSETEGISNTTGTSETYTHGASNTAGTGRTESLHHRPLIQPDEVGRVFARIDDRSHAAYPGLALVMVTGANPLVLRRAHYFEDVQFIDCYSPHPDHKFLPAVPHVVDGIRALISRLETAMNGRRLLISKWLIKPGKLATPGEVAAQIENVPPDNRTVHIRVPCPGKVSQTAASLEVLPHFGKYPIPDGPLFIVKNYSGGAGIDPFQELREACADLEKFNQRRVAPAPAPPLALPPPIKVQPRVPTAHLLVSFVILFLITGAMIFALATSPFTRDWPDFVKVPLVMLSIFGVQGIFWWRMGKRYPRVPTKQR